VAIATRSIELRPLRVLGGAMLGVAALWPLLPAHPPGVCPLRTTTGIPCPLCGMTRAVVEAVHGDIAASLRYHPAGVLAVLFAIVLLVGWRVERVRIPNALLVVSVAALWIYNVTLNPTFN
jgi:hypothetical protein